MKNLKDRLKKNTSRSSCPFFSPPPSALCCRLSTRHSRSRILLRQFFVVVSGLCCQNARAVPIFTPSPSSAITQGYIIPFEQSPLAKGCKLGAGLSIANEQSYTVGDWGAMGVDAEVWRLHLSARGAVQDWGEVGLSVPLEAYTTGVLDPVLDVYHQLTSFNYLINLGKRSLIFVDTPEVQKWQEQPTLALGDSLLWWGKNWDGVWLKNTLALPTGNPQNYSSAGLWRTGLMAGYDSETFGLAGQFNIPLSSSSLAGLGVQPSLAARAWLKMPFNLNGHLELQAQSSPFTHAGAYNNATVSLRLVFNTFSFQEDIQTPLPDVTLAAAREWDCP